MSGEPKEAKTPESINSEGVRFRIPLYQRPYAWEEPQVRLLLDDLRDASKTGEHYHIGILSVAPGDDGVYELIDGQQRITTLALIAKASGGDWFKGHLHMYGRDSDNAYLAGDDDADCNQRMKQTVQIAKKHLSEDPSLAGFIYKHAAFFLSEVPKEYTLLDKNQQFVRFNNSGKQLEKHEILKVALISQLPGDRRSDAFAMWNDMAERLSGIPKDGDGDKQPLSVILSSTGSDEEPDGKENLYRAIVGIEEFLLIALARTEGVEEAKVTQDKTKLLATFDNAIGKDAGKTTAFLKKLESQISDLHRYFIFIGTGDDRYIIGRFDTDKEAEDASKWLPDGDEGQTVIDAQSFLYVSTEPHKWLIPAFDWITSKGNGVTADGFVTELERIDREKCGRPPKLPKLEQMFFGNVPHYWFYRLDYELLKLWRNNDKAWDFAKTNADLKDWRGLKEFRFRKCGSVEHINPRHPSESDPIKDINSFGNLALISGSRNSKFSNNPPSGKMELIKQSGYTESLKMIHALWSGMAPETMHDILADAIGQTRVDDETSAING
jgi:hypothetical protein